MSGICGAWSLGGGETAAESVGDILAQLERRGPDGSRLWRDGGIALGHALLATTPESLVEALPLTDPASGCTIAADARLDNRTQLLGAFDLTDRADQIGDGALILHAYRKWGEECPHHLLGDFAFSIWDPREDQLFCARDHMGMRQLAYCHLPNELFVFATEAEAILAHPCVPRRHNEGRIADYLDNLEGHDLASTFFEKIFRLPPAHCMTVTQSGVSIRRYWQVQPQAELKVGTDEAYAEAFLTVFTEAVRCRLRSAGSVACMLSGGIDSNAVAAVAARLLAESGIGPLPTYSAIGPDPNQCIETRAIHAASDNPLFATVTINHAAMPDMLDPLIDLAKNSGEPFDGHMTLLRAVYLAAHRNGAKVMLDGVSADATLSGGNRIAELLKDKKIRAAIREARGQRQFWGPRFHAWRELVAAGWAVFAPHRLRVARRELLAWVRDHKLGYGRGMISARFARRIGLPKRRRHFRGHSGSGLPIGHEHRARVLRHPHMVIARERYDRVASAVAIEPRDPFLDIRVIEFALSLPSPQLHDGGWPKLVLRRAMRGLVPASVIWRRGKQHLGPAFTDAMVDHWQLSEPDGIVDQRLLTPFTSRVARRLPRPALKGSYIDLLDRWQAFEIRILAWWLARTRFGADS